MLQPEPSLPASVRLKRGRSFSISSARSEGGLAADQDGEEEEPYEGDEGDEDGQMQEGVPAPASAAASAGGAGGDAPFSFQMPAAPASASLPSVSSVFGPMGTFSAPSSSASSSSSSSSSSCSAAAGGGEQKGGDVLAQLPKLKIQTPAFPAQVKDLSEEQVAQQYAIDLAKTPESERQHLIKLPKMTDRLLKARTAVERNIETMVPPHIMKEWEAEPVYQKMEPWERYSNLAHYVLKNQVEDMAERTKAVNSALGFHKKVLSNAHTKYGDAKPKTVLFRNSTNNKLNVSLAKREERIGEELVFLRCIRRWLFANKICATEEMARFAAKNCWDYCQANLQVKQVKTLNAARKSKTKKQKVDPDKEPF